MTIRNVLSLEADAMRKKEVRARAVATVTLDLPVDGIWGDSFTLKEIEDQATRSARELIRRATTEQLKRYKLTGLPRGTKLVGEIQVRAIITDSSEVIPEPPKPKEIQGFICVNADCNEFFPSADTNEGCPSCDHLLVPAVAYAEPGT